MGQLRGLLRGIATYSDAPPVEVLRGLDASMAVLQTHVLATAAVARFEQTDDERGRGITRMRWANAGHLPPLVINPDGSVAELAAWKGDLLLGVDAEAVRQESVVTLDRGSTVLLFTDGLVERRDADLDAGMVRLRETLADVAHLPLQQLLDEVLERLVDGRPEDDVALAAGETVGPLHGLPVAHKDNHATAGMRTTWGSPLAETVPAEDDLVVARLRAAGSVRVGKTNVPEFAAGSHTFNTLFGVTHNPYRHGLSAGGSSGGAAAALAAGLVPG